MRQRRSCKREPAQILLSGNTSCDTSVLSEITQQKVLDSGAGYPLQMLMTYEKNPRHQLCSNKRQQGSFRKRPVNPEQNTQRSINKCMDALISCR